MTICMRRAGFGEDDAIPLAEQRIPCGDGVRLVADDQHGVEGDGIRFGFPGYHKNASQSKYLTENRAACYTRAYQILKEGGATHVF